MPRILHWGVRASACTVTVCALVLGAAAISSGAVAPRFSAGAVKAIPGRVDPTALGCPAGKPLATSTCMVVGSNSSSSVANRVVHENPVAGTDIAGGVAVACLSTTVCVVVGSSNSEQGTLQWLTNGVVTKTVVLRNSSYLEGVTCGVSTCIVVGELYGTPTSQGTPTYGVAADVTEAQSSPGATRVAGTAVLSAVSCATSTSCYAVGSTTGSTNGVGVVIPVTKGHLGARKLAKGTDALTRISCGSPTTCWATGTSYSAHAGVLEEIVPVVNGAPGGVHKGPEYGSAIGCVSATTCFFASGTSQYGKGEVDELSSGKVIKSLVIAKFAYGSLSDITCPTTTSCLVTGATGFHNPGAGYYYTGAVATLSV